MLKMLGILLTLCSCTTIPLHKFAYQVDPDKNALCQLVGKTGKKLKKPICYPVNYKYKSGRYKFSKYGGYSAISMQAIREVLLKDESLKKGD